MNVSRRVTSTVAKSVAGRVTDTGGYSVPPTPSAPSFTSDPEITGNTWVGELLTVSNGTATGYPSAVITYQWKRDTVSISGATSNTYTLQVADDTTDITCTVTRTNSEGSDSATSAAVGPIKTKPANTVAPAVTGSASVDSVLTCSTGTWTGTATITYSYQWYADDVAISGATANTYTLLAGDEGALIYCDVTASNAAGSITTSSNSVGPVTDFTPASLDPMLWNAESDDYDANSPLNTLAVRNSLESYGTYRAPKPAMVAKYDGFNDRATATISATDWTVCFRIKNLSSADPIEYPIGLDANSTGVYLEFGAEADSWGFFDGSTTLSAGQNLNENQWYHLAVTKSGTTYTLYRDGVLAASGTKLDMPVARLTLGSRGNFGGGLCNCYLADIRIYSVVKSGTAIAAIHAGDYDSPDTTGIVGGWWLNEESGSTHYDWSGNGHHLTILDHDASFGGTFWVSDAELPFNPANTLGYSNSGTVVVPRNESSTANDVLGGSLTYTGQCPYPVNTLVPCVTNNGAGTVYLSAAHLTGSETVVSFSGSTTTPTISAGRIDWDLSTTLGDLVLSDGTHYVCQEGVGDGTNRTVYDVSGSGNDATLVNGVVADIWANTLSDVEDWCLLYGGGNGSASEYIPGNTSGSLCVDGSTKTITAGTPNPFTLLDLDPFDAAEFAGRNVPHDFADGDDLTATVTPSNSAFASTDRSRIVVTSAALTGDDLAGIGGYVS